MAEAPVALDAYQWDILSNILVFAGVENLIQLLLPENRDFLNLNNNLKRAINSVIEGETGLQYNNRTDRYSFLHMYLRTPNCIDKKRLKFFTDKDAFLILYDYCTQEGLSVTLNVAYYLWTSNDLMNFRELIAKLKSPNIQLNIELEFDPAFKYSFHGEQFMEPFVHIGKQIKSLVLVQNLKLSKIESLDIMHNKTKAKQPLDALPETLKSFQADSGIACSLFPRLVDEQSSLPRLETIVLWVEKTRDLYILLVFVSLLCSKSTKIIGILTHASAPEFPNDLMAVLDENINEGMMLNSLELMTGLNLPLTTFPTTSLTIQQVANPEILGELQYPQTLKRLNLANNSIQDLSPILQTLPVELEFLNFDHNPISWSTCVPNFSKFEKLQYLRLMNTHIGKNFSQFKFPDSLETLSLEVNQIESIDEVKFPAKLNNLGIGSNKIKVVYKPRFPPTIETVHFTENKISKVDLSTNHIGQPLQLKTLYLNYNKIKSLNNVKLPSTLVNLNFDNCRIRALSDIEFGKTIEELSFNGCEIDDWTTATFESGSKLRYLCLSDNKLRSFGLALPQSVINIDLSLNKINKIPPRLANLQNLKYLNLSQNRIRSARYSFQTTCLEVLDLSFNSIEMLGLSFPPNSETNLSSLDLSGNILDEFSLEAIGHDENRGALHSRLFELDLAGNCIRKLQVSSLLDHLPPSIQWLWYQRDSPSDHEQFYLDTGSNAVCFEISNPTSIKITRTLGTDPLPLASFEYNHRAALQGLPNFDYLVTDAKLDEYFEFGEFAFKTDSRFATSKILEKEKLEFDVDPGIWCLYSPKVSSFEYKVDIEESGYYEKIDDLWWLVANVLISLFLARLFSFGSNPPVLYKLQVNLQLIKVASLLVSTTLVLFNFDVAKYADYISASLDDAFTIFYILGYGLIPFNVQSQTSNKMELIALLCVIPAFATRYFDLKNNIQYIVINNQNYNVIQGVLGPEVFDGIGRVAKLTQDNRVNKLSGPVTVLFAVSKIVKIVTYIYAIRKTLKQLTVANPTAKPYYIWTVVIWLFVWSLVSVGMAPDLFFNYPNVTNYAKVLNEFLISARRRRFITLLWDESHWIVFWLIWYTGNGSLVRKVDVVKVQIN
ncbi:hypothetical protein KGF57_002677 [Candida theae]|uniref:Uncharacterized protein n=1 Tax=Candida theae TaxID=1198502 RepID=A0AAD5FYV3_9ASCO|nr:uncharacterized protein KGF57_002677 [Candida theae]KAI5958322.1 hypothetical protein KGF57_002677 [Candida theae]